MIQLFDGEQKGGGYSQVKYLQIQTSHDALRGGVKIENRENFRKCPNRGGGRGVKKTEMSQFQFGNFENRGGGLYFSKMSQSQLFCNYFAFLPL